MSGARQAAIGGDAMTTPPGGRRTVPPKTMRTPSPLSARIPQDDVTGRGARSRCLEHDTAITRRKAPVAGVILLDAGSMRDRDHRRAR